MATTKSITIPDGYVEVVILFPTSRVQNAIDTFAEIAGYDPEVHGGDAAQKTLFAINAMAAGIDTQVTARDVRIALATAQAIQKIKALTT